MIRFLVLLPTFQRQFNFKSFRGLCDFIRAAQLTMEQVRCIYNYIIIDSILFRPASVA